MNMDLKYWFSYFRTKILLIVVKVILIKDLKSNFEFSLDFLEKIASKVSVSKSSISNFYSDFDLLISCNLSQSEWPHIVQMNAL